MGCLLCTAILQAKVLMQAREKSQLILGEWGLAMQWTIDNSNLRFESHQDWQ